MKLVSKSMVHRALSYKNILIIRVAVPFNHQRGWLGPSFLSNRHKVTNSLNPLSALSDKTINLYTHLVYGWILPNSTSIFQKIVVFSLWPTHRSWRHLSCLQPPKGRTLSAFLARTDHLLPLLICPLFTNKSFHGLRGSLGPSTWSYHL